MENKIIIAGGGVVLNTKNEILLIYRRGFWDLPKGKLDVGETIESCAIREVCEETGLVNVELIKFLTITQHDYYDTWINENVTKITHWYLMKTKELNLVPQQSEDIEQAKWVANGNLNFYMQNSFETIKTVLSKVLF